MSKPACQLTGIDGNAYVIIGTVCRALRNAGQDDKAREFKDRAMVSESYDALLQLCFEYVEVE